MINIKLLNCSEDTMDLIYENILNLSPKSMFIVLLLPKLLSKSNDDFTISLDLDALNLNNKSYRYQINKELKNTNIIYPLYNNRYLVNPYYLNNIPFVDLESLFLELSSSSYRHHPPLIGMMALVISKIKSEKEAKKYLSKCK